VGAGCSGLLSTRIVALGANNRTHGYGRVVVPGALTCRPAWSTATTDRGGGYGSADSLPRAQTIALTCAYSSVDLRRRHPGGSGVKRRQSRQVPRPPAPGAAERRAAEATRLAQGRRAAARLDAAEPAWHVMYRPSTGELMAMAMWDPGFPLVLTDPDPHTLATRMRAAEQRPGQARTGPDALGSPAPQPHGATAPSEPPDNPYRRGPPPDPTGPHGQFRPS
jgi:hypothetical protein